MKVLVTGGREYNAKDDCHHVFNVLNAIHEETPIELIIQGGASGADSVAAKWAESFRVPCLTHYANWARYGNSAGPKRNGEMLKWNPDLVVAFPGGAGTANMVAAAKSRAVPVRDERHVKTAN